MADTLVTESALQSDTAKPMSENSREATPAKSSPEQNEKTMNETSATQSKSKINKLNDKEQQPLESSEKSSKPKNENSGGESEHRESTNSTPKKRTYRNSNAKSSSVSDDEEMEQHSKNSNKKGKSPTDRKIRTAGSQETPKKRSRENSRDTPEKRSRGRSREHSRDRSWKHSRDRSGEHSRDRSGEHSRKRFREEQSDEESRTHSTGWKDKRHHSQSKSPGNEKANKSHGSNSSQSPQKFQEILDSAEVKKTPHKQKNENNITNLSQKGTPQKKGDARKARISPILFDKPNKTETSRSWRKEDSLKLLKQNWKFDKKIHFCFFFGKDAPFSNFHIARFTVDGETYTCSEQFMMHRKAVLFQDWFHAEEIMKAKDPLQMKRFGRKVQNFNAHVWGAKSDKIMKRGLKAKFMENEYLKRELIDTFPRILVEASPRDRLWGIGLGAKNQKAHSRSTWRGQNKLGFLLTDIRNEIMEEEGLFH